MKSSSKYFFILGLVCFSGLLALSVIFFKERIAFCDTAYQDVYLLIEHRPQVNVVRAGSVIPQIIPLAAIWLHAGLRDVMIWHSLSFILFFLTVYLAGYIYGRQRLVFFAAPLYLLLLTTDVFYWPQSELQQGMIWLCLYAVFLFQDSWTRLGLARSMVLHFLFILWIQFFHPVIVFPVLFLLVYYYHDEILKPSKRIKLHVALALLAFLIRGIVGSMNQYEKSRLNILKAVRHNFPGPLWDSICDFGHRASSVYSIYVLVLMLVIYWLASRKQYIRAAAVGLFSLGYWLLVMITAHDSPAFYTENMLLPLSFMAVIPLVTDILPAYRRSIVLAVCVFLIVVRFAFIYTAHVPYTDRQSIFASYYKEIREKKYNGVFVDDAFADRSKAIITWGTGYESILLSSLSSPDSCMMVQFWPVARDFGYAWDYRSKLVTVYSVWDHTQLPDRYFHLRGGDYGFISVHPEDWEHKATAK